jgi:hypothetical protein
MGRSPRQCWTVALVIGVAVAAITYFVPHPITIRGVGIGDIGLPLVGLQNFFRGMSPYDFQLRAGRVAAYPFTGMVVLAPLLAFPIGFIAPVFCGFSAGALAYGIGRSEPWWRLLMFASAPFAAAIYSVQWSPLFTAAILVPVLLPVAAAKPQLGIMLLVAGRWRRGIVIALAIIVLLSFILFPRWPWAWIAKGDLHSYLGRSPLVVGPGLLLLVAFRYWRERIGRLLIAIACVPQRFFYDQLPLLLIPETPAQMAALVAASWIPPAVSLTAGWSSLRVGDQDPRTWLLVVVCTHLFALGVLLFNRRRSLPGGEVPLEPLREPVEPRE